MPTSVESNLQSGKNLKFQAALLFYFSDSLGPSNHLHQGSSSWDTSVARERPTAGVELVFVCVCAALSFRIPPGVRLPWVWPPHIAEPPQKVNGLHQNASPRRVWGFKISVIASHRDICAVFGCSYHAYLPSRLCSRQPLPSVFTACVLGRCLM